MTVRRPTGAWMGIALIVAMVIVPAAPVMAQVSATEVVTQEPAGQHGAEPQEPGVHGPAAQDAEHAGNEEAHEGPSLLEYAFKWINFGLLVVVLWWLLVVPPAFVIENFDFPGLKVILAARSGEIVASRDLAQQQVAEAKTRLEASEARLTKVEEEAAALAAEAQQDAERERQRLVRDAEAEAAKMRQLADRDMGAEVSRARRQLRRQVADLSVSIATDLVKKNFTGEDQDRLVREYLDRIDQTVA